MGSRVLADCFGSMDYCKLDYGNSYFSSCYSFNNCYNGSVPKQKQEEFKIIRVLVSTIETQKEFIIDEKEI